MKKRIIFLFMLVACLLLAACGEAPLPEKAADGKDWDEGWITIGDILGVDTPKELTFRDKKDALSGNGMYYATWSIGEEASYLDKTEDKEQEITVYDAQLFLLLGGSSSVEKAEEAREEWLSLAGEQYQIDSEETVSYNGQEFTVITYRLTSGPYARGASAFGIYGNYAIGAEFSCQYGFEGEPLDYLSDFLEHCHYSA